MVLTWYGVRLAVLLFFVDAILVIGDLEKVTVCRSSKFSRQGTSSNPVLALFIGSRPRAVTHKVFGVLLDLGRGGMKRANARTRIATPTLFVRFNT